MTASTDDVPFFPVPAPAVFAEAEPVLALISPVLHDLAGVLDGITDERLDDPTPCPEYDVTALRDHVVGWLDFFAAALADPTRETTRPDPTAYRVADDPRPPGDVARAAVPVIETAVRAGLPAGEVVMSQARMSGPSALGMVLGEYLVHGWDLAVATGQAWAPAEAASAAGHEFFAGMVTPEYRGPEGFFADEVVVAADAPALDRLIGFAGRDPGWARS